MGDAADCKQLAPCDIFFCFDNSHPITLSKVMGSFVSPSNALLTKSQHILSLIYDEDACRARKSNQRPPHTVDLLEECRLITAGDFINIGLPHLERNHYPGTNMGNKIGDIRMPNYSSLWQMPLKEKYEVHGAKRQRVGGTVDGEEECGRGANRKTTDTVEPVSGTVGRQRSGAISSARIAWVQSLIWRLPMGCLH